MDVIIVERKGILDNPLLIEHNTTAEATFDKVAEELLGEEYKELSIY